MRVLSYNINMCRQAKIDWILAHNDVDVFVVPECANETHITIPEGFDFHWMGAYEKKGLGVITRKGSGAILPDWYDRSQNYAIPIIQGEYFVLAVWPTVRKDNKEDSYVGLLLDALNEYLPYIKQYKTVVIGDYNVISDPKNRLHKRVSREVFDWMAEHGLTSVHHVINNEEYGRESAPTYHHMWKEEMPLFIDYAFTNVPAKYYKLYSWDESLRMSDHNPIKVEI